MKILVTGGAGYIGSHTCIELLNSGYEIVVLDNFCNSSPKSLEIIKDITGKDFKFYECDMLNYDDMEKIFKENDIKSVIHFAGLKAVRESVKIPLRYYHNNITGTLHLLELMEKYGVYNIVFSSSATVYGDPASVPIKEDFPLSTTNPYGATKLMLENIMQDLYKANDKFSITLLRYFNPIGAHKSGRIGENPKGIPNNLLPYITQVAVGKLEKLHVFGDNYPTRDGTGVRDYIHVVDLSLGHVKAVDVQTDKPGVHIYNLGTGNGTSVLELMHALEQASGVTIPYVIDPPRPGDIAECYADASRAKEELGWVAQRAIPEMCEDSWRWQKNNPNGFDE